MLSERVVYWDSNVFLSYINGIPERVPTIRDVLAEMQESSKNFILTSSESIAEVTHMTQERTQGRLDPAAESKINAMWEDTSTVRIIDNGSHIAFIAQELIRDVIPDRWSLQPKDAIHLASAYWYDQNVGELREFHTYDQGLFKYQTMIGIHIDYPHVLQHRMNLEGENDIKQEEK